MADIFTFTKQGLDVSSDFEGNAGPASVVGSFDGMGLSCGYLSWAFGAGSQQPLVKNFVSLYGKQALLSLMPKCGPEYLALCCNEPFPPLVDMNLKAATEKIALWSNGAKMFEPYNMELAAFWGSEKMVKVQVSAAQGIAQRAIDYAKLWSEDIRKNGNYLLSEFLFFFDIMVQNGGLKDLWLPDVLQFERDMKGHQNTFVCEWCTSRDSSYASYKDSIKNGKLWATEFDKANDSCKKLFILGWQRALKCRPQYQANVFNRRGILALGVGYAEGGDFKDLRGKFGPQYWVK